MVDPTRSLLLNYSPTEPCGAPKPPLTYTTNTAAYAAVELKTSDLLAVVRRPTTIANKDVNRATIPNLNRHERLYTSDKQAMAPTSRMPLRIAAMV
jgi:hypothetical protein